MSVTLIAITGALFALSTAPAQALSPDGWTAGETTTTSSRAYEEAVAECMADRGFEYAPWIYTVESTVMKVDGESVGISLEEFVGGEDPNEEIVDALTVAERIAYYHALNGSGFPLDSQGYPTYPGNSITISDGSCADQGDTP